VCDGGTCSCAPGTPDTCGTKCVNRLTDGENCGSCGHSCLGGTCDNGKCQPVQIYAGSIYTLTYDADYLYFTRPKTASINVLARVKDDGSGFQDITSVDLGLANYSNLAIVNNTLYWSSAQEVRSCALPSCSGGIQTAIPGQNTPWTIYNNSSRTRLFWHAKDWMGNPHVYTNPASPTPLVDGDPDKGAADDSFLYYGVSGNVYRVPVGGGAAPVFVGQANGEVVLSGGNLFYAEEVAGLGGALAIYKLATTPVSFASLVGYRPDKNVSFGDELVVDGSTVYWYWSGDDLDIMSCPVSGCSSSPTDVVTGTLYGNFQDGLVVRSDSIIFGTDNGIYRLAK
jgi:hypothetical protein